MKEINQLADLAELLGIDADRLRGGLNLTETAEVLGMAPSTLRRKALEGRIAYVRNDRVWRFYWPYIADFIAEHFVNTRKALEVKASTPTRRARERKRRDVEARAKAIGLL